MLALNSRRVHIASVEAFVRRKPARRDDADTEEHEMAKEPKAPKAAKDPNAPRKPKKSFADRIQAANKTIARMEARVEKKRQSRDAMIDAALARAEAIKNEVESISTDAPVVEGQ